MPIQIYKKFDSHLQEQKKNWLPKGAIHISVRFKQKFEIILLTSTYCEQVENDPTHLCHC